MAEAIRFLFRYRDLVAPTLTSHREVIGGTGVPYCWWGWWKRPTEDARLDIWSKLAERVAQVGHETVGLFHSGEEVVHTATVIGVVRPVDEKASTPPVLEADERDRIPAYYRHSVFSRAWLKISEFSNDSVATFFKEYAYADPPPLPEIDPLDLEVLRGKRIISPGELRRMDTTIWTVQPARGDADASRFLAASTRVTKPLSTTPISLARTKILHLTDIHYDVRAPNSGHSWARPGRQPLHEMISAALDTETDKVGLLVVTGDLTFCALEEEFNRAKTGLSSLMGKFDLGANHVLLCPGNHDIAWTKDPTALYNPAKEIEPEVAPDVARAEYAKFYEALLQHEPNHDLSMGRRYVLPHGRVLEFCALNSSSLAAGAKYLAGMGQVGPSAFEAVRAAMNWRTSEKCLALRVLLLHHHVVSTENVERPQEYYDGFGLAIDSQKTLREATKAGVRLVLHGHRHRAFYWRTSVYELPEYTTARSRCGDVSIIGGGSAGSDAVVDESNYFNLIDLQPDAVLSTMYRSQRGGPFSPLKTWEAKIDQDERGVVLSDWTLKEGERPRH